MKLIDNNGKEVAPTLKAICDAVESPGGIVETEDGKVRLTKSYGNEALDRGEPEADVIYHIVDHLVSDPDDKHDFDNIDEAYIRFRFLVEAYYHVGLPSL